MNTALRLPAGSQAAGRFASAQAPDAVRHRRVVETPDEAHCGQVVSAEMAINSARRDVDAMHQSAMQQPSWDNAAAMSEMHRAVQDANAIFDTSQRERFDHKKHSSPGVAVTAAKRAIDAELGIASQHIAKAKARRGVTFADVSKMGGFTSKLAQSSSSLFGTPSTDASVKTKATTLESGLVQCFGFGSSDVSLVNDIQIFPPGQHTITALKDGKKATMDVRIGEDTARTISAAMSEMMSNGRKPFFDFNHEDREASAWVQSVYWAGEDPQRGGVRAKVEWTDEGAAAVKGKRYRQFSPNYLVDKAGNITGTTVNMGGLVNRPAFNEIQPFFAKSGDQGGNQNQKTNNRSHMSKLTMALQMAGLVSAQNADNDEAAAAEFGSRYSSITAKEADLTTKLQAAEGKVTAAEERAKTLAGQHADLVVAKAVQDGIIAAKDTDAQAYWKGAITANPEAAKGLGFIVRAKAAGAQQDVTRDVVVPRNGTQGSESETAANGNILVLAKHISETEKIGFNAALVKAAKAQPEKYETYRKSLLFVQGQE